MIQNTLTHRELSEIGAALLRKPESANGHGCHFSIVEPSCYGENPDVFGIRHGSDGYDIGTILLEAKTSHRRLRVDLFNSKISATSNIKFGDALMSMFKLGVKP